MGNSESACCSKQDLEKRYNELSHCCTTEERMHTFQFERWNRKGGSKKSFSSAEERSSNWTPAELELLDDAIKKVAETRHVKVPGYLTAQGLRLQRDALAAKNHYIAGPEIRMYGPEFWRDVALEMPEIDGRPEANTDYGCLAAFMEAHMHPIARFRSTRGRKLLDGSSESKTPNVCVMPGLTRSSSATSVISGSSLPREGRLHR
mmetsp:Transcript_74414/g.198863  ORF Transcript_74414/g.198863 Transcript_74414/m.198863 type:complete len:205 (-) Transcript_74414:1435-2049(-)